GMPSFTLLGPKIIRFPFILHSSYPHELLHNWWGNSVFVDYEKGNWCEGLTVLLADHMIKQQRGQGAEYRKSTLQGYTHYAAGKPGEFPLSRFKARYDALSSAIGYGKSMMMFHMLRGLVGDKVFKKAVSVFYRDNKFKRAGFDDIKAAFESTSQIDLDAFFHQWVQRTGIPELRISAAAVEKKGNSYVLGFSLLQSQNIGSADLHGGKDNLQAAGRPYTLRIPVAVHLEGQKEAVLKYPVLSKTKEDFQYEFTHRPLGVDIDPQFDVFRKLHESEIPPTLSNAFGADAALMLLPSAAPAELLKAYRTLAETWAGESKEKITIQMDKEITRLPPDKAVWLLGKENIHRHKVAKGIEDYGAAMEAGTFKVEKRSFALSGNAVIAAIKNPGNPRNVIVSLSSHTPAALPGLARKLPHYGKYSYLGFDGDEPTNILKGQWPVVNSPMTVSLDSSFSGGTLPKSNPLARLAPLFSEERMMKHVSYLASEELEGRGLGYKGLEKAAHYIAVAFRKAGLQPAGDKNSYIQSWEEEVKGRGKILLKNVIAKIPGTNPALKNRPVILCAHYDHLGLGWPDVHKGDEGKIHPGADDNASGVAVMLELAHTLGKSLEPQRPLVFIAFTGEENGLMGSTHYVKKQIEKGSAIMAAVNLDTVGRLPDKTPYMVIGSSSAREWKYIFMGIGFTIGVESRMAQQLDSSDQTAFIRAGIPAVHLFSGPHADYHRPTDTIDKIIPAGLVKIASATREAILYLAERKEPLTNTIKNTKSATGSTSHKGTHGKAPSHGEGASSHGNASSRTGGRRVRTGMMPDFSFSGKGMKVGAVSPDSAAAKAGLKKGDIITAVAKVEVTDLRSYSTQLKKFKPGDIVIMEFLREEKKHTASITLEAR
ncbi:MAG: M20/M25/M40 family metallo-hydrolase, partial [bacterium]|nr:M20/M25/M40 family metallo-hydrolase [bacterium]